jgi:hypothetical protein
VSIDGKRPCSFSGRASLSRRNLYGEWRGRLLRRALLKTLISFSKPLTTRRTELLSDRFADRRARRLRDSLDIGRELKVPVTTDVHSGLKPRLPGRRSTCCRFPAFLCRQTDLLRAAAETGRAINVKKGPVPRAVGCAKHRRETDRLR